LTRVWRKWAFDPHQNTNKDWLLSKNFISEKDESMSNEMYENEVARLIDDCEKKKEEVKEIFNRKLDEHFEISAELCGLKQNNGVKIREAGHLVKSIAHDSSEDNLRRLCWTMYTSCLSAYKNTVGEEMCDYLERFVMEEINVVYNTEDETKPGAKNCIVMWMNKLLNNYRCNVKEGMTCNKNCAVAGVLSNVPKGVEFTDRNPKPKKSEQLFWISNKVRDDATGSFSYEGNRKVKKYWSWVSTQCRMGFVYC
jgi:hypothetical protein